MKQLKKQTQIGPTDTKGVQRRRNPLTLLNTILFANHGDVFLKTQNFFFFFRPPMGARAQANLGYMVIPRDYDMDSNLLPCGKRSTDFSVENLAP